MGFWDLFRRKNKLLNFGPNARPQQRLVVNQGPYRTAPQQNIGNMNAQKETAINPHREQTAEARKARLRQVYRGMAPVMPKKWPLKRRS